MTEYAWPASLRPSRLSFYLQHNTQRFVSPVSRATQVLRRDGEVLAVGFAYDTQEVPPIPAEPTDQPLDLVVTDRRILVPAKKPLARG